MPKVAKWYEFKNMTATSADLYILGDITADYWETWQPEDQYPEKIRNFGEIDNIHSCAAYLETIKEIGVEIDLFYLMDEADKVLGKKTEESEKFKEQIERLKEFYDKGYSRYLEEHRG